MTSTRFLPVIAVFTLLTALSGCLGDLIEFSCLFSDDASHCYQSAAVQNSDPNGCEKVTPPAGFTMSNPPQDKCYLQIAQNTGDYSICKKIKGGIGSYSEEECILGIVKRKGDPLGCKELTGVAFEDCKKEFGGTITPDKLKTLDEEIDALKSTVGSDPSDADAKKRLDALLKEREGLLGVISDENKQQYQKGRYAEVLEDVEDEEVKSEIRREFIKWRSENPEKDIDAYVKRLEAIKEEKEFVKRMDDQANELVDSLKEKVGEYADEQKEAAINAFTEKGWSWAKEKSGDDLKRNLERMEALKEKYDKASEKYAEMTEKIDKIKKVYEEVKGVYTKVDSYNKLVAEGKIDQGQAKVLKGAVLLGKGLEYATSYVPIFGSTISKVTAGTFEATIKLATSRAQRSTKLNACIEDPENCDPNGISGY